MYLYFSPKSIVIYLILGVISYATGGLNGLLWFALISLAIGGVSLIYDYVENRIRKKKEVKEKVIAKPISAKKLHNFKVIHGGKSK